MNVKKATYTLPIEAIKQIDNLSKRYGKSKSKILADLIMESETKEDKIINASVKLETDKRITMKDMIGKLKSDDDFDPVDIRKKIFLDKAGLK
jgi:predicted DNA-binding protein